MESMLLLAIMFGVMYLLMIRPESKRKKKVEAMRAGLRKGDTVTTIGGIVGKVVSVKDDLLTIETSEDRVRIQLVRWAIQNVEAVADKTAAEENIPENKGGKKGLFGKKAEETVEEPVAVPEEPVAEAAAEETTEEQ